jgi:phage terminase large subunit
MFLANHPDIFSPPDAGPVVIEPWKPHALTHDEWPPDYRGVYAWRIKQLAALRADPVLLASAKAYYATRPGEFIMHWMDTYNPRKQNNKWVPFVFFTRQAQFIEFLEELDRDEQDGLIEKARDIGATWLFCAFSVSKWLFVPDDATGVGSRKQDLVDKIGDPDSIFEKMRLLIKRLPDVFLPKGWKPREHATFMKLINPENGSTITGESGDNIGRGGRKKRYGVDEAAHIERAEKVEASLGDNTNVRIDMSSVNGLGNVFHRKREAGIDWAPGVVIPPGFTRVFVFDWRDHPEKTQAWYDQRKAKAEREGMQHVFAQEVDRNYSAAIQNTIIPYEWIAAAIDAHLKLPYLLHPAGGVPDMWMAGLDVADEGIDRNALALRQWIILRNVEEWGERDTGVTTRRTVAACRSHRGIGVGSGVKSEFNRLVEDKLISMTDIKLVPWNAGAAVINPYDRLIPDDDDSLLNKDFFKNMKAQAWWSIRTRFYKTWRAITQGELYNADELISLDGTMPLLHQAAKELAQPTLGESTDLRTIVNKKPDGTKSPNLGDAIIQAFFPIPDDHGYIATPSGTHSRTIG